MCRTIDITMQKNGKVRVDKWKNERAILNNSGDYVKE